MSAWELPISITVNNTIYKLRTDFRAVLDVLAAMNDPDLFEPDSDSNEKAWIQCITGLQILIEDFNSLPPDDYIEAWQQCIDFVDCGMKDDGKRKPHTMDWQQDAQIIIPAINRIQGTEIRALSYLHWWTFVGAYMEIGECLFSQVVNIRQKKATNKKLEKWEKEFYNANKEIIDLKKRVSEEQQKEMDALEKWL